MRQQSRNCQSCANSTVNTVRSQSTKSSTCSSNRKVKYAQICPCRLNAVTRMPLSKSSKLMNCLGLLLWLMSFKLKLSSCSHSQPARRRATHSLLRAMSLTQPSSNNSRSSASTNQNSSMLTNSQRYHSSMSTKWPLMLKITQNTCKSNKQHTVNRFRRLKVNYSL